MAQVRITDNQGTARARIPLVKLVLEKNFTDTTLGRVTVSRDDLNSISNLTPGQDRIFIEHGGDDIWGGVLKTPGRSGGKPTMMVHGFSQYARRAESVPLGQEKVSVTDSSMIEEAIDATPQLSKGTIQTLESGLTFIFSGISPFAKAKKVAESAGGELVFNEDLTVDYVAQQGSDKTGTTLSPANGSFTENRFNVDDDGISGNTTHIHIYGAGQGSSQIQATIVPEDDPASYPGKATYTHPTWSDGDDKIWDRRTNKDIKRVETAQSWGQTLIDELQQPELRVDTVVKGTEVNLGDRFHVFHPEEDVDQDLRAVEVVTEIDAAGPRYEVVFSNYSVAHFNNLKEDWKDTERYRSAFEGDLTRINDSPGRGPVGSGNDYRFAIDYPDDVIHEVDAELQIVAQNYRSFHAGAADGGGVSATSDDNSDATNVVESTVSGGTMVTEDLSTWETLDTISPSADTSMMICEVRLVNENSSVKNPAVRLVNFGTGNVFPSDDMGVWLEVGEGNSAWMVDSSDVDGDILEAQIQGTSTNLDEYTYDVTWWGIGQHNHFIDIPDHTHDPDPGIIDFAEYPSNVDVFINGQSQGLSLGNGVSPFEETVTVTGELSAGWNDIWLTSDTLGHISATFSGDLYRQKL